MALNNEVYLWNAQNGVIDNLLELDGESEDYVTCVSWIQQGCVLAVGISDGTVQVRYPGVGLRERVGVKGEGGLYHVCLGHITYLPTLKSLKSEHLEL